MSFITHPLVMMNLDDLVDTVGVKKWALMTLGAAIVGYGLIGANIPYAWPIAIVATGNFAFWTAVTVWWKLNRHKYEHKRVFDRVKQQEGRN